MKIWRDDGRILYSDEHRLIGSRYPLGDDELTTIRQGKVAAEVSDLDAAREPLRAAATTSCSRSTSRSAGPTGAAAPVRDLRALQLGRGERPAAVGAVRAGDPRDAARALDRAAPARVAGRAAAPGGPGRARDPAAARDRVVRARAPPDRPRPARRRRPGPRRRLVRPRGHGRLDRRREPRRAVAALREAAAGTRRTIRELRTLLVDIYPPDLHRTGLTRPLATSSRRSAHAGSTRASTSRTCACPSRWRRCSTAARRRPAQRRPPLEGVARRRAGRAGGRPGAADGRRRRRGLRAAAAEEGHFGLRLLGDLARESGGRLEVRLERPARARG